ncbi:glycosyltransferase family 4 protein [Stenotrophomonas sp.]|uniref:glycosyltransferase family 4 protein n=1 Tax=Stenotrophomonas sp. TaxID=69392 RepID=UPI0028AB5765|nr:glycosyltransferase family 4 protein [Stenotrophomonas sp.]
MTPQGSNLPETLPRLLVIASTYPRWRNDVEPGFVHELSKRLTNEFKVTVLCPHAKGAHATEILDGVEVVRYRYAPAALEKLVNNGGIVTNLSRHPWMVLLVPGFLLGQMFTLIRLLRKQRPNFIHAHWVIPQGLTVTIARLITRHQARFTITSHGADLFALRGLIFSRLKKLVFKHASSVTVVSQAMRDETTVLGIPPDRVAIAPMGTDLNGRFTPDNATLRSRTELLFVGRIVEKKGLQDLIQALPIVLQKHPDTSLSIAGFGPEQEACMHLADALGISNKIRFLGAVQQAELPNLYRRATALIAPFLIAQSGDQEGLGLVMVEAIGCNCPVVTTQVPAVKEVFNGEWPPYVAIPRSPSSLAEQIIRLMNEPELAWQWTAAFRPQVLAKFDYISVAGQYASIIKSGATT